MGKFVPFSDLIQRGLAALALLPEEKTIPPFPPIPREGAAALVSCTVKFHAVKRKLFLIKEAEGHQILRKKTSLLSSTKLLPLPKKNAPAATRTPQIYFIVGSYHSST